MLPPIMRPGGSIAQSLANVRRNSHDLMVNRLGRGGGSGRQTPRNANGGEEALAEQPRSPVI